jgi:hypothetical protein
MFECGGGGKPERASFPVRYKHPEGDDPMDAQTTAKASDTPEPPEIRTAIDAEDIRQLKHDPSDEDAKLDVALDESFPTSDAPSNTQPGKGKDPAPSSGYDPEAEAQLAEHTQH